MEQDLLPKIGHYDFIAEPFHCDFTKHYCIGHLGNILLNAADYHSNDRGYGMNYLNTVHRTWVLSRLAIELEDVPLAYDKFFVETWVDSAMRYFTSRNFKVANDEGHTYGYGRSIWALIDTDSRQPTDILSMRNGLINVYIETEKECPIKKPSRVKTPENLSLERIVDTYYSDVDVNGHINSIKYIDHILDLWPLDWHKAHPLKRIDIAYVAETHQGDQLMLYTNKHPTSDDNHLTFTIIVNKKVASGEEIEACRCSLEFR